MYTYQNAVLRKKGKNQRWELVNISLVTMVSLFKNYVDGHITLINTNISPDPLYVDLKELKASNVKFYNIAFETWLQSLVDTPLPFLIEEPTYTSADAIYADAWQARYSIVKCKADDPYIVTGSSLTEARLNKPNIDTDLLTSSVLTSVNGLFHINYGIDEYLIVKDAVKSMEISKSNSIGLLSFANIGNVIQLPITTDMIKHLLPTIQFKQSVVIDTGLDLTNKSVLVSIGGYLHINDRAYDVFNSVDGLVKLNMEMYSLPRRIMEMKKYIDVSSLDLDVSEYKPNAIDLLQTQSNEFLVKLLTLSQSFIIIVDTPLLTAEAIAVNKPLLPGFYEYGKEPLYPLRSDTGRLHEYWSHGEYGRWVLSVTDNMYRDYAYETTEWKEGDAVNERVIPDGRIYSFGKLLKISSNYRA